MPRLRRGDEIEFSAPFKDLENNRIILPGKFGVIYDAGGKFCSVALVGESSPVGGIPNYILTKKGE